MSEAEPQTYANHRRIDPQYHFVAFGLLLIAFVMAVVHLVVQPGLSSAWELVASVGLLVLFFRVRVYALQNQDRLIRLEETLRMERLLSGALKARLPELRPGQLVALRFAPDEELEGLVQQALAEDLDREAIKKRIRNWRPDTFRI